MAIFSGILAWITLFLFVLLAVKGIIRLLAVRFDFFKKVNKDFSKIHKPLGILILFTSLLHGLTSSVLLFSFNIGTLTFLVFILLFLSYFLKRYYRSKFVILHRVLTLISISLVVIHLVDVGGFKLIYKIMHQKNDEYIENIDSLKDGTFEGTGTGLKGEVKVSVEIRNGKIHNIVLLESKETPQYMEKVEQELKDLIIQKNSASIDVVSGATYASNGYLEAVRNALKLAKEK